MLERRMQTQIEWMDRKGRTRDPPLVFASIVQLFLDLPLGVQPLDEAEAVPLAPGIHVFDEGVHLTEAAKSIDLLFGEPCLLQIIFGLHASMRLHGHWSRHDHSLLPNERFAIESYEWPPGHEVASLSLTILTHQRCIWIRMACQDMASA